MGTKKGRLASIFRLKFFQKFSRYVLKTYSKRTWKIVFGAIKMCLNLNLKPRYELYLYQNFVLHIFGLHRCAWPHIRTCSIFGSEKVTFCKDCMIQKSREKVFFQIFWWKEIVSMDPKSNVKLLGDHFEYSYIFKKCFLDCFLSTSLLKTVDIKLFFYGD